MTSIGIRFDVSLNDFERTVSSNRSQTANQTFQIVDEPVRSLRTRISAWYNGINPLCDKISALMQAKIRAHILTIYGVTYNPEESIAIEHTFKALLDATGYSYRDLNRVEVVCKLMEHIPQFIVAVNKIGKDLRPAPMETSTLTPDVVHVIQHLMGDEFDTKFLSWSLIKSILFSPDNVRSDHFRQYLNLIMGKIHQRLENCSSNDETVLKAIIVEMLCAITSSEPSNGETVEIPQKIGSKWELVKYSIEVIPLTSEWVGVIPALGLKPLNHLQAQPILLFRPTPQPSSEGALVAYTIDAMPFTTIGECILNQKSVKERIFNWIESAYKEFIKNNPHRADADSKVLGEQRGVILAGKSFGGIHSIQEAGRNPQYISEVLVSGAPTPFERVRNEYLKHKNDRGLQPRYIQYVTYGDEVPLRGEGYYPGTSVIKVIPPNHKAGIAAHSSYATTMGKAIMVQIDPSMDARMKTRTTINRIDQLSNCIFFPIFSIALTIKFTINVSIASGSRIYDATRKIFKLVPATIQHLFPTFRQQPRLN